MPENLRGTKVGQEGGRVVGYPINLQSLLQTLVLVISLLSGVFYAAQRITTLENKQDFQQQVLGEQRELLKEMRDDQRRALENQRIMREKLDDNENSRRR